MIRHIAEAPFIRIIIPFLVGIILFYLHPITNLIIPCIFIILLIISILFFNYLNDYFKYKFSFFKGILIKAFLFLTGYLLCILHQHPTSKHWYGHHLNQYQYAIVKVVTPPEQKQKSLKVAINVLQLIDETKKINTKGKAIIYFKNNEKNNKIIEGDYLLVKNKFSEIQKSGNPGSFNYAAYSKLQNIYHTTFLNENEWQFTSIHVNNYETFFADLNKKTRKIIKEFIPDSTTHGIAEALLLGYRLDIDDEIWQAYTDAGIVHIIAISGMHMAMIYASIKWLLMLIPFMKKRKIFPILIAILSMWIFAFTTGLPASVLRAAVMFSFIGLSDIQNKKMNIYNALTSSAFCMLCVNPMLLFNVGFQLSYAAVFSIVIFYKPIYNLMYVSKFIPDLIWQLIAITLAAQILTFPICIYYFHQFPLMFLLTNLFAVPSTTLILYLEILLVFFSWLHPIAKVIGWCVSNLILFVNKIVLYISGLSFAVWSEINISFFQMILLYFIILCFGCWLFYKKEKYVLYVLSIIFLMGVTLLFQQYQVFHQKKIIVYNIPNQKSIEFIAQKKYFNPDINEVLKNKKNESYTFKPAHTFYSIAESDSNLVEFENNNGVEIFSFLGKKILRIEHTRFKINNPLQIDLLILSNKCNADINFIAKNIITKQIILDSSIPFWKVNEIKKQLAVLKIPIHDIKSNGAFILDV